MRGNDVVLKLDEKLYKVFIMLQIELFTQPVTADLKQYSMKFLLRQ
ncbi:MAG: hypothetical protein JWQ54_3148 [Mucilaginibacter sp.]|nr:hypothetical protein [Mucilaginibacter sp.]